MRDSNTLPEDLDAGTTALPVSPASVQIALHKSRDEMNLAEFPLTVLSKRVDPTVKTLEFSDIIRGKNGEVVNRKWIITGADKFGLPTASDDEVLLGLLKLTANDGLENRKIFFTRYELLRILRWTTEGRSYTRLQNALDRLSGVRIKATNAFYDNEAKLHSTRNFGIIDAYEINDGRDTRPSFFIWSEVLFKSFQAGFIKKLDLDFFLELRSAVSKRLYRYLDKHFWYRSKVQMNLFTLAHEKIGISRNYSYASSIRQQIDPALDELKQTGFISSYEYAGRGSSTEIIIFANKQVFRPISVGEGPRSVGEGSGANDNRTVDGTTGKVAAALVQRGIALRQASRLVETLSGELLAKVERIIEYFDRLIETKSHLVARSPVGFLYRAVENPVAFCLPEQRQTPSAPQTKLDFEPRRSEPQNKRAAPPEFDESRYLVARKRAFDTIRNDKPAPELAKVRADVEQALAKLRNHLSPGRFDLAVEHGVQERLLKEAKFPTFETWLLKATAGD